MSRLITFLCALSILAGVTAWGQTPPQLPPAALARIALRGTNLPPGAPPPKYFTVTGWPVSSRLWKSPDFKNWSRLAGNPATETNGGGCQMYRAEGAFTQLSWTPATNASGYLILEWCNELTNVWLTIQVPATNTAVVPAIIAGTNYFTLESLDSLGDFSALSKWATNSASPPRITITPTNALAGTNAP